VFVFHNSGVAMSAVSRQETIMSESVSGMWYCLCCYTFIEVLGCCFLRMNKFLEKKNTGKSRATSSKY